MNQLPPSWSEGAAGQLSPRQLECLALVAEGLTSKEIARRLSLSPSTVDSHISAAVRQLGCVTRAEAIRAVRNGHGTPSAPRPPRAVLPPLGGRPNDDPPALRLGRIGVIAVLSVGLSAAMIAAIVGTVTLLQQ